MGRIQWTRASQFNWVFDNMGGTPLQEAVAGNWQQAVAAVDEAGCVAITVPNPGGGQVCWVRGVWPADTTFPWEGFWAEPMGGDLTNYYPGGSFANEAEPHHHHPGDGAAGGSRGAALLHLLHRGAGLQV